MDRVGPTNPYHISKAYGVQNAQGVVGRASGPRTASNTSFPIRAGVPLAKSDAVDAGAARMAAAKQRISGLVAARVSEQPETNPRAAISATRGTAINGVAGNQPSSGAASGVGGAGSFPMYRHPADKNAVATAIDAGRVIDLNA